MEILLYVYLKNSDCKFIERSHVDYMYILYELKTYIMHLLSISNLWMIMD